MRAWRHLLKGIGAFTCERLKELAEFGKGNSDLETMTAEVVKEVASRFKISFSVDAHGNSKLYCGTKGMKLPFFKDPFMVAISIQGWGAPGTFEMGGLYHLKELNRVAEAVGSKFTIKEVKAFDDFSGDDGSTQLVAALVDGQQGEARGGLHKLEFQSVTLFPYNKHHHLHYLLKASEVWKIQTLSINLNHLNLAKGFSYSYGVIWMALARNAVSGQIGTMKFPIYKGGAEKTNKEDVKHVRAVWEISEKFEVKVFNQGQNFPGTLIQIGGGRGEDPKTTWEEAYETVLNNIC